jgi:hypothetical protein
MNVAIYLPEDRPLTARRLRALAPGAHVRDDGGIFKRATRFEVTWEGARVEVNTLPAAELPGHLRGFQGYVSARCQVHDRDVLDRIGNARTCLGVVVEPAGDPRAEALIRGLHEGGLMFRYDGVYADDGTALAEPVAPPPAGLELEPYPQGPPPGVEDPDAEEPPPPPAERVARRAMALALACLRGMLEEDPGDGTLFREVQARAQDPGVARELEAGERALILTPLGQASQRAALDASWRLQGVAVLAWALSALELPPHDEPPEVWPILDAIGLRSSQPPAALASPRLRAPAELDRMGGRLLGLHWRLVDFRVAPRALDFRAFSRKCWFGSFDLEGIPLAGDDLAIGGRPISEADPQLVRLTESIARERHQAINWLQGFDWAYSRVDTST